MIVYDGYKSAGSIVHSSIKTEKDLKYVLQHHCTYRNEVVESVKHTNKGLRIETRTFYKKSQKVKSTVIMVDNQGGVSIGTSGQGVLLTDINQMLYWVEIYLSNKVNVRKELSKTNHSLGVKLSEIKHKILGGK